ncbi:peptidylprolyl isomerase, partial [Alphaproteobacteria bacterium]|nr:peptidylprolyl isomerase [Alphaproteobacteria bacterium]
IGEQEIDEQYEKAVKAVNQTRYLVSEILLNLDNFSTEEQVRQLSDEIVKQLQAGVAFPAIARQFSIAPTAAQGGQLGWISADQLNPRLSQVVRQLQPGQISAPVPTTGGIYILALVDKRAGGNDPSKNKFDVLTVGFKSTVAANKIERCQRFQNLSPRPKRRQKAASQCQTLRPERITHPARADDSGRG